MDLAPTPGPVLWKPSRNDGIWIYVVGLTLALAVLAVGFLVAFRDLQGFEEVLDFTGVAVTIGLTLGSLMAHEAVHGLGYLACGGRPTFGIGVSKAVGPYFSCTAPGQQFSVPRYVAVGLAPTVVVNGALVACFLSGSGGLFILPLAAHLGAGCVEDWFTVARALKAPEGSLIEDVKGGLVIYTPAS
jgi:hypothetical protein